MRKVTLAFGLLFLMACGSSPQRTHSGTAGTGGGAAGSSGQAGTTGTAGSGTTGTAGSGDAGTTGNGGGGTTGTAGDGTAGTTGTAGDGSAGTTGTAGDGTAGTTGAAGDGTAGTTGAAGDGTAGTTGVAGSGGAAGSNDAAVDAPADTDGAAGGTMDGGGPDVPTSATIQINAGTTDVVPPFIADADYTGGAAIKHANVIDLTGVTRPAPLAVYQTARTGTATYTIPGFTAGSTHLVRLHFAETYWTMTGQRTFNVSLNGTAILSAFDVVAAAGAANKALIREFIEPASAGGSYVIQLTSITDKALVSGIEIY